MKTLSFRSGGTIATLRTISFVEDERTISARKNAEALREMVRRALPLGERRPRKRPPRPQAVEEFEVLWWLARLHERGWRNATLERALGLPQREINRCLTVRDTGPLAVLLRLAHEFPGMLKLHDALADAGPGVRGHVPEPSPDLPAYREGLAYYQERAAYHREVDRVLAELKAWPPADDGSPGAPPAPDPDR